MKWTLNPYVGCGPLRFDMSPNDVQSVLGPPDIVENLFDINKDYAVVAESMRGMISERRGFYGLGPLMPTLTYRDSKLVTIQLYEEHTSFNIGSFFPFAATKDQIALFLQKNCKHTKRNNDMIVCFNLGMVIAPPEQHDPYGDIVVFGRGEYEDPSLGLS